MNLKERKIARLLKKKQCYGPLNKEKPGFKENLLHMKSLNNQKHNC